MTTIFVRNVPYSASTEEFGKAFEPFGEIVRAFILTMKYRGQLVSRGIGFVEFKTAEAMNAAVAQSGKLTIRNRQLNIQVAMERRPRITAFVLGIPKGTTKENLMAAFQQYKAVDARVVYENRDGEKPRLGFGFVKFESEEDLNKCVAEAKTIQLNGAESIVRIARRHFDAPPRRYNRRRPGRFNRRGGYRKAPRN